MMQESIFDIFGTGTQVHSCRPTVRSSSTSSFQTLKGADNVRLKISNASDPTSTKKALGDVGNKIRTHSDTRESRKLLLTDPEQENSFLKPPIKTPLPNKRTLVPSPNKLTPDLKSTVRTPLSDVKVASSPSKQLFQNPSESTIYKEDGKYSLSELNEIYNFTNGDREDLSWMPDDIDEIIDDYEDIIPNSLRPSEDDVHRVTHFWEMCKNPLEFEFDPMLPPEVSDSEFWQAPFPFPDIDLHDDLHPVPVPVFLLD